MPRRTVSGLDPNRLALLIAVLGRRAGIGLATHDVYANLAGGLRVDDPALDLPLAIALASSLRIDRSARARLPSARSACSASCARSPASSAGCGKRPASGSSARSCRREASPGRTPMRRGRAGQTASASCPSRRSAMRSRLRSCPHPDLVPRLASSLRRHCRPGRSALLGDRGSSSTSPAHRRRPRPA